MKRSNLFRDHRGQALNEMLIVIPLLMILATGLSQLTIMVQEKIEFENACGRAARQFALGQFSSSDIGNTVWVDLGPAQKYFEKDSINIYTQQPKTLFGGDLQAKFGFLGGLAKDGLVNYGGADWTIAIRYRAIPLLGALFPNGVLFQTHLAVLRHPA